MVQRHVREGEVLVHRQREVVARFIHAGHAVGTGVASRGLMVTTERDSPKNDPTVPPDPKAVDGAVEMVDPPEASLECCQPN